MQQTIEQTLITDQLEQLYHDTEVAIKFITDMVESGVAVVRPVVMEKLIDAGKMIETARRESLKG